MCHKTTWPHGASLLPSCCIVDHGPDLLSLSSLTANWDRDGLWPWHEPLVLHFLPGPVSFPWRSTPPSLCYLWIPRESGWDTAASIIKDPWSLQGLSETPAHPALLSLAVQQCPAVGRGRTGSSAGRRFLRSPGIQVPTTRKSSIVSVNKNFSSQFA